MGKPDREVTVDELFDMFTRINEDCEKTGESVVGFDDEEFYADQIANIHEGSMTYKRAEELAAELAQEAIARSRCRSCGSNVDECPKWCVEGGYSG